MKRKRRDAFGYGEGEDISDESEDDEAKEKKASAKRSKSGAEGVKANIRDLGKLQGQSASQVLKQMETDKKK